MRLSEIAKNLGCDIAAREDVEITGVAGIDEAHEGHLTFVSNRKYVSRIHTTRASAIILGRDIPAVNLPSLRTSNPYLAFAKALELFYSPSPETPGIHPTAVVSDAAVIGKDPTIGAYCVIGPGCRLGDSVVIHPHVVLYRDVEIGSHSVIHASVVIRENCRLGRRVIIQNGCIIGSDGFGFAPCEDGSFYKIVQTGRVVLEDDVEIGANTTIDRAAVGETVIRAGAKLDNLIQIGHGSEVGENTVLAAQVGVAGSTKIGKNARIGGQVGLAGHLDVGNGAVMTAQSGTSHDVPAGAVLSGSPAIPNAVWLRAVTAFSMLPDLVRRVRRLEKEVQSG